MRDLLSRLRKVEGAGKARFEWTGQSGREYCYEIYSLGADFKPVSGNYIYARLSEGGHWVPIYVAQTRDLHQRPEGCGKHEGAIQKGRRISTFTLPRTARPRVARRSGI